MTGDDYCDVCGRLMPLTGDSLCRSCHAEDERRRTCIVCRGPKVFLDEETCSDLVTLRWQRGPNRDSAANAL